MSIEEATKQDEEARAYIADLIPSMLDHFFLWLERARDASHTANAKADTPAVASAVTYRSAPLTLLCAAADALPPHQRRRYVLADRGLAETAADAAGEPTGGAQTTSHSESVRSSLRVLQLKVARQVKNSNCGFYALHNGLLCYETLAAGTAGKLSPSERLQPFQDTHLYLRRFWSLHGTLAGRCTGGEGPGYWTARHLRLGIMERSYMDFLLADLKKRGLLSDPRVEICSLPAARASLTAEGSYEDVSALQEILDRFWAKQEGTTVFLLGVVNHWVTVAANKSGDACELVLMDSNQCETTQPLLDATEKHLWEVGVSSSFSLHPHLILLFLYAHGHSPRRP